MVDWMLNSFADCYGDGTSSLAQNVDDVLFGAALQLLTVDAKNVVVDLQSAVFSCNTVVVDGADDQLAVAGRSDAEAQTTVPSFVQFNRLNQSRMNVLDVVFVGCEDDALPLDQSFFTADRAVGSRQGHGEPLVQVAIGNALRGAAFQRRRRRVERHKLVVRHDVIVGVITGLFLRCSFLC